MHPRTIVIVGAGLAGATAAFGLREAGYDGELVLVGEEPHPPYNRPSLSKEYLRGEQTFEDLLVKPADAYSYNRITLRLGERAVRIDPAGHAVTLEGGERLGYERLLVATGGRNRSLPAASLPGILQLRTVDDADRIRSAVGAGARVVVVGMGFAGSEMAASIRQLGAEVSVIQRGPTPFASTLGERVGSALAAIHRDRGVRLLFNDRVAAIEGSGRVERVVTEAGHVLACDVVVVAIGVDPNVELLQEAGAAVNDGVVVDEHCATSIPDVFAAGDIASSPHPIFGRTRVEHWNNAFQQGRAAALSMLGHGPAYDYIHSFWSDQFDHSLEYVGYARAWDEVVFRGSPGTGRFLGFYLAGDRLRAAVGLDRGGDPEDRLRGGELKKCAALIRSQARLDPHRLAREDCLLGDAVVA